MGRDGVERSIQVEVDARLVAEGSAADLVELRCVLPAALARARLVARSARGTDASDATATIATTMSDRFEPWPGATSVDTVAAPAAVTTSLLARLDALDPAVPVAG